MGEDLLNYSQISDNHDLHQRLPDSFENSRDIASHANTDDEDPSLGLGLFMSCDINMPSFFSSKNTNAGSSMLQSKLKSQMLSQIGISQSGQQSKHSNLTLMSQRNNVGSQYIGDGNSLRNQLAVQSLRDISSYDVKKIKASTDKENQEPNSLGFS